MHKLAPVVHPSPTPPSPAPLASSGTASRESTPVDFCENCGETRQLAKIKGCIRCLTCGFKADCSGM